MIPDARARSVDCIGVTAARAADATTTVNLEETMLLIREVMYCKPGKVRPMVEKFLAMKKLGEEMGMGKMRVLTDLSAERFWTLVAEIEVPSIEAFMRMGSEGEEAKKFEEIMKGYHDLVDHGRREIYTIEGE
jgi:hypothetical protein